MLVLGCERLLREGRLRGRPARLAAAQAQAARLLAVGATGAGWPTRRGDILRRGDDRLASALTARAGTDPSAAGRLLAAHDLLDEIAGWLRAGDLRGPAAPSAFDRLQVAQALLREHRFGEPLRATADGGGAADDRAERLARRRLGSVATVGPEDWRAQSSRREPALPGATKERRARRQERSDCYRPARAKQHGSSCAAERS